MTAKLYVFENHNAYTKTREQVSWFLPLPNFSGIIEPNGQLEEIFLFKIGSYWYSNQKYLSDSGKVFLYFKAWTTSKKAYRQSSAGKEVTCPYF